MKLAIAVVATESHTYTMEAQARAVQANLSYAGIEPEEVIFILVGDDSSSFHQVVVYYGEIMPEATLLHEHHKVSEDEKNYTQAAQLLIAQLRTQTVTLARSQGVDMFWSLDSDVLPPSNALRCSLDMVSFDKGKAYQVAACPYPSQGGGPWLCGRGTYQNRIATDILTEEHALPDYLRRRIEKLIKIRNEAAQGKEPDRFLKAAKLLDKIASVVPTKYPPMSDPFGINAGGKWRKRGWFNWAYPALGWGAVVPSDWCGMGCTLISKPALDLTDWIGYAGEGTEDLYVIWEKWWPQGIRIAAIPHAPCHHVVRVKGIEGKYVIVESYHEHDGEYVGHLRQRQRPFYQHKVGEQFEEENDGVINHLPITNADKPKKRFMEMDQPPLPRPARNRKRVQLRAIE